MQLIKGKMNPLHAINEGYIHELQYATVAYQWLVELKLVSVLSLAMI